MVINVRCADHLRIGVCIMIYRAEREQSQDKQTRGSIDPTVQRCRRRKNCGCSSYPRCLPSRPRRKPTSMTPVISSDRKHQPNRPCVPRCKNTRMRYSPERSTFRHKYSRPEMKTERNAPRGKCRDITGFGRLGPVVHPSPSHRHAQRTIRIRYGCDRACPFLYARSVL